jgi:NADPH:quinone reductase-like Zn-dependent oxidoreductase
MKAYAIYRYSKEDKLQLIDITEPVVNDNDVLVQIHATSINQLDAKLKSGEFKLLLPYKFPLILGHDVVVDYSFLLMKANGNQLSEIGSLIESGVIHPVVDKVFPFEQMNEAMSYVQSGRAKGKVIVQVR